MSLFADLKRLRADLDALRPLAPEQEARVLQKFRLEWNYNSNAIEGNSLTLGETRSLLLHGLTAAGKPMRDHLDIKGHNKAVLWLEDIVKSERPLTEQFIRGMHEVLLGEPYEVPAQTPDGQPTRKLIQPGRYKSGPNNVLTATGEMFYFASPEETPARMTDLVDWYRQQEPTASLHPVALAAEFHYRFVRIHPFDDGNGRMSRLLMNLILLRHGYPMTVIKAADRNRYLAALAEADAGEFEPFLGFIVENVEDSLRLMIRAARGESIEEPSDLDKKLALLKREIFTRNDAVEIVWNLETQATIFDTMLSSLFFVILQHLERFDDFFSYKKFLPQIDYYENLGHATLTPSPKLSHSSTQTISFIEENLTSISTAIDSIQYNINWSAFRQLNKDFSIFLRIVIIFRPHSFFIGYNLLDTSSRYDHNEEGEEGLFSLLHSRYKEDYTPSVFHEIGYQLANKVYDFIAAKLAEADTLPA